MASARVTKLMIDALKQATGWTESEVRDYVASELKRARGGTGAIGGGAVAAGEASPGLVSSIRNWFGQPLGQKGFASKVSRGGAALGGLLAYQALTSGINNAMTWREQGTQRMGIAGEAELNNPENLLAQMRLPDALAERRMAKQALVQHLLGITGPSIPKGMIAT